jgi:hypothetical protein
MKVPRVFGLAREPLDAPVTAATNPGRVTDINASVKKSSWLVFLKMLQRAPLNRVPFGKFNRASAIPVVRLRRTGLASELP